MENIELDLLKMGEKLVKLRGGKTQEEVSNDLKISKSALAMYEKGKRIPRDTVKIMIARYYGKSISYIFFNEKEHES